MSVSSIQNSISSIQREIQRLQRRKSDRSRDIANKSKRISDYGRTMNNSSSRSMIESKMRQIYGLEQEINRHQAEIASVESDLTRKTEKLHYEQNRLQKEQIRESQNALKALERKQHMELERRVHVISDTRNAIRDSGKVQYDVFISHSSEDKMDLVEPLAAELKKIGLEVWYDKFCLKVGDSLRKSIDVGLRDSRFGIVVLSPSFLKKSWAEYELNGLVQREMEGGKVILPLWHKITKTEVMSYSPSLADKLALNSMMYTIEELAHEFSQVINHE